MFLLKLLFPKKFTELNDLRVTNYNLTVENRDLKNHNKALKKRLKGFKKANTKQQRTISKLNRRS